MDHGSMGEGDGPTCKISMLWNWYTIDACFLAESWHVTSSGQFAASCIGVILLVITLEVLRRLGKEYDSHMYQQWHRQAAARFSNPGPQDCCGPENPPTYPQQFATFRATPLQQTIRSVIHMATFAVAYFIMLLAMYFNGYIIICIFIGALLGKFLCDWTSIKIPVGGAASSGSGPQAKGEEELTYCCG
ncbi:Copper transport protein ctr4 [Cyphellophora attinorum]|uniref:Copper transport protein n=1 Tax=Cyphellophora attinorum TaxID=1664694 RepID=A0A0N1H121_9EURO|nr:Copper transport protein ctr4 [Phialophora attinorum]KPI37655.1 Copper transport protein ctr4 [Phialophora attinorum]